MRHPFPRPLRAPRPHPRRSARSSACSRPPRSSRAGATTPARAALGRRAPRLAPAGTAPGRACDARDAGRDRPGRRARARPAGVGAHVPGPAGRRPRALRRLRGPALLPRPGLDHRAPRREVQARVAAAARTIAAAPAASTTGDLDGSAPCAAPRPQPGRPGRGRARGAHRSRPLGRQGLAAAPRDPGRPAARRFLAAPPRGAAATQPATPRAPPPAGRAEPRTATQRASRWPPPSPARPPRLPRAGSAEADQVCRAEAHLLVRPDHHADDRLGLAGYDAGQTHWADRLGTTTGGTAITDMVRVVNAAPATTGATTPAPTSRSTSATAASAVVAADDAPRGRLPGAAGAAPDPAQAVLPLPRRRRLRPLPGRPRLRQERRPADPDRLLRAVEPAALRPLRAVHRRVQWRGAYRSYRANQAHFQHNIGV